MDYIFRQKYLIKLTHFDHDPETTESIKAPTLDPSCKILCNLPNWVNPINPREQH